METTILMAILTHPLQAMLAAVIVAHVLRAAATAIRRGSRVETRVATARSAV